MKGGISVQNIRRKKIALIVIFSMVFSLSFSSLLLPTVQAKVTYQESVLGTTLGISLGTYDNWTAAITLPGGLDPAGDYFFIKEGEWIIVNGLVGVHILILDQANYTLWSNKQSYIAEYDGTWATRYNFNVEAIGGVNPVYLDMGKINISQQYYLVLESSNTAFTVDVHGLDVIKYEPDQKIPFTALFFIFLGLTTISLIYFLLKKEQYK